MEQCVCHVDYQLPKHHSIVGYILKVIKNNDPVFQAVMADVHTNKVPGSMRNYSEACVDHTVPYCLVSKNRTAGTNQGAA